MARFHVIGTGEFHTDDPDRDILQGDMMFEVYDELRGRPFEQGLTEDEATELAERMNSQWPRVRRERHVAAHNARLHRGC